LLRLVGPQTGRRGLRALALVALLVVGCGARGLTSCEREVGTAGGPPAVAEVPQVVFPSVAVTVELARTDAERAKGLGGHAPLGERDGMLFIFDHPGLHAFWMKGMTFALDILWIEDGQVVHLEAGLPPPAPGDSDAIRPIYVPRAAARYVLEVNAGFAEQHGIGVGTPAEIRGL
jgi:uncharacterized membrane protein (UPF0127 family)